MAVASSLVAAIATLVCFLGTRRSIPTLPRRSVEMSREGRSARSVWTNFLEALKNRELLMLVLMIFVLEAGFHFRISVGVYGNNSTHGLTRPMVRPLGLVIPVTSVLSHPPWGALTKRFQKKTTLA